MKKQEILTKLEPDKGDTDYVLRTDAEDKTFLENYKSSVIEKEIAPKIAEVHTQYDEDLFKLFGKRKKSDEKTYNFLKNEFEVLKSSADKVIELEKEIVELKKGKPDDAKLQEIKDLQKQIIKINADHDAELKTFAQKMQRTLVKAEIEKARKDIKIKAGIPDSVLDVYFDKVIDKLVDNAEIRENSIVFLDADKKAKRNPATMAPYTAKELLLEELPKEIVDTGHQQQGPVLPKGTAPVTKGADGKFVMNFTPPPEVTSREKLGEWLVKETGIKRGSQEYREAYAKFGESLPPVDPKP
jgi:hypothetical protein